MNRLAKMIGRMNKDDLLLLRKDLQAGHIETLIERRLDAQPGRTSVCPTCGARVDDDGGLLLQFGPKDLRQQARFDAVDCMRHFVEERLSSKR